VPLNWDFSYLPLRVLKGHESVNKVPFSTWPRVGSCVRKAGRKGQDWTAVTLQEYRVGAAVWATSLHALGWSSMTASLSQKRVGMEARGWDGVALKVWTQAQFWLTWLLASNASL
jgi:hypothetical protein